MSAPETFAEVREGKDGGCCIFINGQMFLCGQRDAMQGKCDRLNAAVVKSRSDAVRSALTGAADYWDEIGRARVSTGDREKDGKLGKAYCVVAADLRSRAERA